MYSQALNYHKNVKVKEGIEIDRNFSKYNREILYSKSKPLTLIKFRFTKEAYTKKKRMCHEEKKEI